MGLSEESEGKYDKSRSKKEKTVGKKKYKEIVTSK